MTLTDKESQPKGSNPSVASLERRGSVRATATGSIDLCGVARLARRSMRRENPQHTLETGALLNEAYLRLADWKNARWENRAHFYGVAAQIMRRVLVDHARAHAYQKRGGGARPVSLDEAVVASPERAADLIGSGRSPGATRQARPAKGQSCGIALLWRV